MLQASAYCREQCAEQHQTCRDAQSHVDEQQHGFLLRDAEQLADKLVHVFIRAAQESACDAGHRYGEHQSEYHIARILPEALGLRAGCDRTGAVCEMHERCGKQALADRYRQEPENLSVGIRRVKQHQAAGNHQIHHGQRLEQIIRRHGEYQCKGIFHGDCQLSGFVKLHAALFQEDHLRGDDCRIEECRAKTGRMVERHAHPEEAQHKQHGCGDALGGRVSDRFLGLYCRYGNRTLRCRFLVDVLIFVHCCTPFRCC